MCACSSSDVLREAPVFCQIPARWNHHHVRTLGQQTVFTWGHGRVIHVAENCFAGIQTLAGHNT